MKYHSLPSLSDLKAYQQGKLSSDERSWIDSVIDRNPLVAEVFKNAENTNSASVQRVSASVTDRIAKTYTPNRGFWSKYAGWIGLSSIAMILGSVYFLNTENISPKYSLEQSNLNIKQSGKSNEVSLISDEHIERKEGLTNDTEYSNSDAEEPSGNSIEQNESLASNSANIGVSGLNPKLNSEISTPLTLEFDEKEKNNKTEPDNTRTFDNNESNEKTGTVLLALNSVNILSKLNPDDFNTRETSSGGGNPLGRSETKRQNNASYSMEDLPSYPGGDQALINYFKGKLRPIEIPAKVDQFDRSVMIELEVNSRGKLKDYQIFGNLHPTHQKQLEDAIKELPQFEKGNGEKVKYSLAISF